MKNYLNKKEAKTMSAEIKNKKQKKNRPQMITKSKFRKLMKSRVKNPFLWKISNKCSLIKILNKKYRQNKHSLLKLLKSH